jgi:uncharacterized protein (DUF2235 family)
MSIIFTERQAIRIRLEEIRESESKIREERQSLLQRLRELDNQERQSIDTESIMFQLMETVNALSRLIPHVPINVVLEDIKRDIKSSGIIQIQKDVVKPSDNNIVDHETVVIQKAIDSKLPSRRGKQQDIKKLVPMVISIFKNKGTPMKSKEIENKLFELHEIKYNNFTNFMIQLQKHDSRIEKVKYGIYQYKA